MRSAGPVPAVRRSHGPFGRLYMTAIKPFRYLIVYPALTRQWERAWRERYHLVGETERSMPNGTVLETNVTPRRSAA